MGSIKVVRYEDMGLSHPAKDSVHIWALVNTVKNLRGPGGIFLDQLSNCQPLCGTNHILC
jgi:hypothetical protein